MISINFRRHDLKFVEAGAVGIIGDVIINDNYKIFSSGMEFKEGDVILDIGANEGIFSIMMAKLFPVKVVAYEPAKRAFRHFLENLELNNLPNIEPYMSGIAAEAGRKDLNCHRRYTTVSSSYISEYMDYVDNCEMVTLDDAIKRCGKVKLLKIDIEGGEYEAFYASKLLARVENVVGEFHINKHLRSLGYDMEELEDWLKERTNVGFIERKEVWE